MKTVHSLPHKSRWNQKTFPRSAAYKTSLIGGLILVSSVVWSSAANCTWIGSGGTGGSGDWGNAAYWNGGVPTSGSTVINAGTGTITVTGSQASIASLNFDTNAGSYTIGSAVSSGTIAIGNTGAIQILSTLAGTGKTETINSDIVLGGAIVSIRNLSTTASNTLVIAGNIYQAVPASNAYAYSLKNTQLTLGQSGVSNNTGANSVSGNIYDGSFTSLGGGAVRLSTNLGIYGVWTLSGANTFTGATAVTTTGTLKLGNANALQNSTVSVASGGSLIFNSGIGTFTVGGLSGTTALALTDAGNTAITLRVGNNDSSNTYTGILSGGGNLVKTGKGTLVLGAANTYSGTTTVANGTLIAGSNVANSTAGSFGNSASAIVLGDASTTTANGSPTLLNGGYTISRDISTSANSTLGTYTLGGNVATSSTISGAITLNQPLTLVQTAANGVESLNITGGVSAGGGTQTLTFAGPGAIAASGAISDGSGNVGVTVKGGKATLTGTNTYTGITTVAGGTLNLGGSGTTGSISSSSALRLGGGALNFTRTDAATQNFAGTTVAAGASKVANGFGGNTIGLGAVTRNIGGTVDIGSLGKISATAIDGILGGYATYGGSTWATVNGGTVTGLGSGDYTASTASTTAPGSAANVDFQASNGTAWTTQTVNSLRFNTATAATLALASGNTLTDANGGILVTSAVGANDSTISGGTLKGASGQDLVVIQNNTAGKLIISSVVANNTTATALTKSGAGVLRLTSANTYSGGTYLNEGVIQVGNASALGTGTVAMNAGTRLSSASTTAYTLSNALSFSGGTVYLGDSTNTGTLTLSGAVTLGGNTTFAVDSAVTGGGVISDGGAGYGLTKTGTGTLTINKATTYTGATTVNAGTLLLDCVNSISGVVSSSSQLAMNGGNLLVKYQANAGWSNQNVATLQAFNGLSVNSGASVIADSNSGASSTDMISVGAISRSVGATLNLNTQGVVETNYSAGYGTLGWATMSGTSGNTTAGATTFASLGSYSSLTALSSYTANTATALASGKDIDMTAGNTSLSADTSINNIRFNTAAQANVTIASGKTLTVTGGGILVTATTGAIANTISGGTIKGAAGQDLVIHQYDTSADFTINSAIADNTSATALTKTGSGVLVLGGNNTYTGGTYLNMGTIRAASSTALGAANAASLIFGSNANGKFQLYGNDSTLVGLTTDATTPGTALVENGAGSGSNAKLTVNNTADNVFAGTLQDGSSGGTLALAKSGAGKLVLTGSNNYSGGTTVTNGTLLANNTTGSAIGTGTLSVSAGATIGGIGKMEASSFTIGGTVQVGNGSDATSSFTLKGDTASSFSGAHLLFNVDTGSMASNLLNLGGTHVDFTNTLLSITLLGNASVEGGSEYTLISGLTDYTGLTTFTNTLGQTQIQSGSGLAFEILNGSSSNYYLTLDGNAIDLVAAAVPEPSTWAFIVGGAATLLAMNRRRRTFRR